MKAQVVSFHCVLKDITGRLISSTFNQDVITHTDGAQQQILHGLAQGLQNLKKGEKRRVVLSAEQAYGYYDPRLVIEIPRKRLDQGDRLKLGQQVQAQFHDGALQMLRVISISRHRVILDGNHPLAGQDLVFEIEATDAREASAEEIAASSPVAPVRYLH